MKRSLWITIVAVLVLASCSPHEGGHTTLAAPPQPSPPPSAAEKLRSDLQGLSLDAFYVESYAALLQRTPERVIWLGLSDLIPPNIIGLNDLSDSYQRETFAMHQVVLELLQTYDRSALTPDEQLSYDIYEWQQQDETDRLEFIYYDFVATYNFFGAQRDTESLFLEVHPLETLQDARDYITRLNAVDEKFTDIVRHLVSQNGAGIVEPILTMDVAISNLGEVADAAANTTSYYTVFVEKINNIADLSATDRQELADAAFAAINASVIPAYQQLRLNIRSLRQNAPSSVGVAQYPLGAEYYNYILKHHTTTDLTAAEVHQLGLDELARIQAEMRVIFDQATQYLVDTLGYSVGAAQGAAGRYSVVPAQATAYMVGMLQILESRQRAIDALGAQFSLIEFHRLLLSNGAVLMDIMNREVDRWIQEKLAAP